MNHLSFDLGMNDPAAWTPVQERAEFFDGMKESPCKKCRHIHMDKNKCRTFVDCPIRIKTLSIDSMTERNRGGRPKGSRTKNYIEKKCQFPGCENTIKRGRYCVDSGHTYIVSVRKKRYPDNPEKWFEPVRSHGGKRS